MMEIVIALSQGEKCCKHVVPRRMLVVERALAEPMGKRVDAEGSLMQLSAGVVKYADKDLHGGTRRYEGQKQRKPAFPVT